MKLSEREPGATVCVYGRGTASLLHRHRTVKRVTKTIIVVGWIRNGQEVEARFNREFGYSLPRLEWGGSAISTRCQKSKE